MENFRAIELHQVRDFSRKISVVFEFLRQNFKPLGKSLIFIAGPAILVSTIFAGDFYASLATNGGNPMMVNEWVSSSLFWLELFGIFLFAVLAGIFTVSVINNYVKLYDEKQSSTIEVHEVWQRVRSTFWRYFATTILTIGILMFAYIVTLVFAVLLLEGQPAAIFTALIIIMCGLVYLATVLALVFPIRSFEKIGFFNAFSRAFFLIYGKWWSTFGVIFITWLISYIMSMVFIVPVLIYTTIRSLHAVETKSFDFEPDSDLRIIIQVLYSISFVVSFITQTLPLIAVVFQYFNLVERKEAKGLMARIESFGEESAPATEQHDEHY